MTSKNKVYKVVVQDKDDSDNFLSVCSQFSVGDMRDCVLAYRIGQITKPQIEHSKILAFDRLDDARLFASHNCNVGNIMVILICNAPEENMSLIVVSNLSYAQVSQFWSEYDSDYPLRIVDSIYAPPGTIGCDWVKPIALYHQKFTLDEHGHKKWFDSKE